ncbi:NB-ARC domain-containing protein [Pseudanabaena sp. PCC 6802]|uniref:NB-ARC domain-containing protein n=1 Tax=Pseudanabaena sp. PCC 6802 TaxID=118173 RepID=UPI0003455BBF|nr:NB-ARC domain-containing protein [Pseudanabaena sp. PCC 6802]
MTVDEALTLLDTILCSQHLTPIQESVFCKSWEGITYEEIASESGYDCDYIKQVGSQLWRLLSEAFGEKVTKKNVQLVLSRYDWQGDPETIVRINRNALQKSNQDWGEAANISVFFGRTDELATLEKWIVRDRCCLVAILGMGGIGKTGLSVKLARQVQREFEYTIWRSLHHAPSLRELIEGIAIADLQDIDLPDSDRQLVACLLRYLQKHRCLVVLDSFEAILQSGQLVGAYREGYQGYGELLRQLGEVSHQSCIVLTSREEPGEVANLAGETLPVRAFRLAGLSHDDAVQILHAKGLTGSTRATDRLVKWYMGNPLELKMVATIIQDLFEGRIAEFLKQGTAVFQGIYRLLEGQIDRLTDLEIQIMYWLATHQGSGSYTDLWNDLSVTIPKHELLEALSSLRQRSLIDKHGADFHQQLVVMEYMTEKLIAQFCQEGGDSEDCHPGCESGKNSLSCALFRTLQSYAAMKVEVGKSQVLRSHYLELPTDNRSNTDRPLSYLDYGTPGG